MYVYVIIFFSSLQYNISTFIVMCDAYRAVTKPNLTADFSY